MFIHLSIVYHMSREKQHINATRFLVSTEFILKAEVDPHAGLEIPTCQCCFTPSDSPILAMPAAHIGTSFHIAQYDILIG